MNNNNQSARFVSGCATNLSEILKMHKNILNLLVIFLLILRYIFNVFQVKINNNLSNRLIRIHDYFYAHLLYHLT